MLPSKCSLWSYKFIFFFCLDFETHMFLALEKFFLLWLWKTLWKIKTKKKIMGTYLGYIEDLHFYICSHSVVTFLFRYWQHIRCSGSCRRLEWSSRRCGLNGRRFYWFFHIFNWKLEEPRKIIEMFYSHVSLVDINHFCLWFTIWIIVRWNFVWKSYENAVLQ